MCRFIDSGSYSRYACVRISNATARCSLKRSHWCATVHNIIYTPKYRSQFKERQRSKRSEKTSSHVCVHLKSKQKKTSATQYPEKEKEEEEKSDDDDDGHRFGQPRTYTWFMQLTYMFSLSLLRHLCGIRLVFSKYCKSIYQFVFLPCTRRHLICGEHFFIF